MNTQPQPMKTLAMQVEIPQPALAAALRAVRAASSSGNSYVPVLNNALIDAGEDGRLRLAATTLDVTVMAVCTEDARIDLPGAVTVPAHPLADLVAILPDAPVHLAVFSALSEKQIDVVLECGETRATFKGIDAGMFPPIPAPVGDPIVIPGAHFAAMTRRVRIAVGKDSMRPILTGVKVQVEGARLTMAAADGYRLAVDLGEAAPVDAPKTMVIPPNALGLMATHCEAGADVELFLKQDNYVNLAVFRAGAVEIAATLVDGTFPDYEKIIPKSAPTRTVVPTTELRRACKRAHIFARDGMGAMRLDITPGPDELTPGLLTISGSSPVCGQGTVVLDAAISGPACQAAFNAKYFLDALRVIESEKVVIETGGSKAPATLRPATDDPFLYVVMPMSVQG